MQTCPKCGYIRKPTDVAPEWECPQCGIAYAKYGITPHGHAQGFRTISLDEGIKDQTVPNPLNVNPGEGWKVIYGGFPHGAGIFGIFLWATVRLGAIGVFLMLLAFLPLILGDLNLATFVCLLGASISVIMIVILFPVVLIYSYTLRRSQRHPAETVNSEPESDWSLVLDSVIAGFILGFSIFLILGYTVRFTDLAGFLLALPWVIAAFVFTLGSRIFRTNESRLITLLAGIFGPSMVFGLCYLFFIPSMLLFPDSTPPSFYMSVFLIMVVITAVCGFMLSELRDRWVLLVAIFLAIVPYSFGAVSWANVALDRAAPIKIETAVIDKKYKTEGDTDYHFRVHLLGNPKVRGSEDMGDAFGSFYDRVKVGGRICFIKHPGYFGFPYATFGECPEPGKADSELWSAPTSSNYQ